MIFRKMYNQRNYISLAKPTVLLMISSNMELEKMGKEIESKLVDVIENSK